MITPGLAEWAAAAATHAGLVAPADAAERLYAWTGSELFAAGVDRSVVVSSADAAALVADPGLLGDAYAAGAEGNQDAGRYYTPKWVVDVALEGVAAGRALDPACGGGRFLLGLLERGADVSELTGIDADPVAVAVCRFALWLAVGRPGPLPLDVRVEDALAAHADGTLAGGYDVVVGNPPYRAGRFARLDPRYRAAFEVAEYQLDPYPLFLELALAAARPGGAVSMVVPNAFLSNLRCGKLRAHLLGRHGLERLVELPEDTFDAGVDTVVVGLRCEGRTADEVPIHDAEGARRGRLVFDRGEPAAPVAVARTPEAASLVVASRGWRTTLGDVAEVTRGVNPYHHTRHTPEEIAARVHHADHRAGDDFVPELRGRDLGAYRVEASGSRWIRYGPWLKEPRDPRFFEGPRLVVRKILGETLCAAYLEAPLCCDQSVYIAKLRPSQPWPAGALLAVCNSRVVAALLRTRHHEDDRLFPQLKVAELRGLPLPPVDPVGLGPLAVRALALQDDYSTRAREAIEAEVAALYGVAAGAISAGC